MAQAPNRAPHREGLGRHVHGVLVVPPNGQENELSGGRREQEADEGGTRLRQQGGRPNPVLLRVFSRARRHGPARNEGHVHPVQPHASGAAAVQGAAGRPQMHQPFPKRPGEKETCQEGGSGQSV